MTNPPRALDDRGPIAWMADNPVAANLLMLVLMGGGVISASRIKQEVFPSFETDQVVVSVRYPGASPAEVEQGIVLAIEESVRGLDGVKEVTARAQEGLGSVTVDALIGADLQRLAQDVKQEIDRIITFPEEAEEPQVVVKTRRRQVLSVVLYGDQPEWILRNLVEMVRDQLLQDPEIAQADLAGVRAPEISVEVPREQLRAYNLTPPLIADRIRRASVELPGGGIKTDSGEILLRMKERRDYGRQFADIPILTRPDGTKVKLGSIARIVDGFEDTDKYATYNGKRAVMINVYRVGDQTPIEVSAAVRRHVDRLSKELPPEVGVAIQSDFSQYYRQRKELLLKNGLLGLGLVLLLLGIFLEARLAFWVTLGIPISFLGALFLLPTLDVSLNMVSLFAFIVGLGIVVDDAIVVGENVYAHHQRGAPFALAAKRGAQEVVLPVTFSVLTNVCAFMPLFFVPGFMGKVFRMIPAVVVFAFIFSLVESLFILPAHLAHQKDNPRGILGRVFRAQRGLSNWLYRVTRRAYGPIIAAALRNRYLTLSIAIAIMAATIGLIQGGHVRRTFFPRVESDRAVASAELPFGASIDRTKEVQARIVRAANEVIAENGGEDLASGIFAEIGGRVRGGTTGGHRTSIQVYLTEPERRPISTAEFVKLWRERTGFIPGLENSSFLSDAGGPGSGPQISVELSHNDLDVLERASADLARELNEFDKIKDVNDGFSPGKRQFDFKINPAGHALGMTAIDVARQVRGAFYGTEVLRQQRGRNEVKVMVRLPKEERISEADLDQVRVRTPSGKEVLLTEVVNVSRGRAYTAINRREGQRVVTVTADTNPRSEATRVIEEMKATGLPALAQRHSGLRFGFEGRQRDMKESLMSLAVGFLIAMLVVYTLLAVPLKSYVQPVIIMIGIPFGIVGATLGHMAMGFSLSIISMFGIVALSGVVVNDALILIDFANRRFRAGTPAWESVYAASLERFRPILLTTLTTFFGLSPMIFETSRQARFLIPMAISLGFGILFATGITLLLVPSLYLIIEDIRDLYRRPTAPPDTRSQSKKPAGTLDAGSVLKGTE